MVMFKKVNRDLKTTEISIDISDMHSLEEVDIVVDPQALMREAIENLPDDLSKICLGYYVECMAKIEFELQTHYKP